MTSTEDNRKARQFNAAITTALRDIGLIPGNVRAEAVQVLNTQQNGEPVAIITARLLLPSAVRGSSMPDVQTVKPKPPLTVLEGGRTMSRTKRKKLRARRRVETDDA